MLDQTELVMRPAVAADLRQVLDLYAQPDFDAGNVLPLETARQLLDRSMTIPITRSTSPSGAGTSSAASPCW
jgi:hypothetical protein